MDEFAQGFAIGTLFGILLKLTYDLTWPNKGYFYVRCGNQEIVVQGNNLKIIQ